MAGRKFSAVVSTEAITASNTETLLQVRAATNHAVKILGWGVAFAGTSVTEQPIRIELLRASTTTTGTSAALSLVKWDDSNGDTIDATATQDYTVEPTAKDILAATLSHPQAGYEIWYPEGKEPVIGAGDHCGVRVTTGSGVSPSATAYMVCEE